MQWQAQLLAQYSGHIFILNSDGFTADLHADLESSLTTLHLRAENSDWKCRNTELLGQDNRLKALMEMRVRSNL
jgi:hypothetical protein